MRPRAGLVLAVVVLAGCGSRAPLTGPIRSAAAILTCLHARHIAAGVIPLRFPRLATSPATPSALIAIDGGGATTDIAVYRTRAAAADVFARQGNGTAELLAGNTIEQLYGYSLPPGPALPETIQRCAFGAQTTARRSVFYAAAYRGDR